MFFHEFPLHDSISFNPIQLSKSTIYSGQLSVSETGVSVVLAGLLFANNPSRFPEHLQSVDFIWAEFIFKQSRPTPALRAGIGQGTAFLGDNWQICRSLDDAIASFAAFTARMGWS